MSTEAPARSRNWKLYGSARHRGCAFALCHCEGRSGFDPARDSRPTATRSIRRVTTISFGAVDGSRDHHVVSVRHHGLDPLARHRPALLRFCGASSWFSSHVRDPLAYFLNGAPLRAHAPWHHQHDLRPHIRHNRAAAALGPCGIVSWCFPPVSRAAFIGSRRAWDNG